MKRLVLSLALLVHANLAFAETPLQVTVPNGQAPDDPNVNGIRISLFHGKNESVRGVEKWPTNVERCYGYWRTVGTDCGICMAVCPFSHRDNPFHGLVRSVVRHARWTHRPAVWFDDLVYGRRWNPAGGESVKQA